MASTPLESLAELVLHERSTRAAYETCKKDTEEQRRLKKRLRTAWMNRESELLRALHLIVPLVEPVAPPAGEEG